MKLESLPYLEASIEDFLEALSRSRETSPKNKRHSVLLLEEAFEFVFYALTAAVRQVQRDPSS